MNQYISQLNALNAEQNKGVVEQQHAEQRKRIGLTEPPTFPHRRR